MEGNLGVFRTISVGDTESELYLLTELSVEGRGRYLFCLEMDCDQANVYLITATKTDPVDAPEQVFISRQVNRRRWNQRHTWQSYLGFGALYRWEEVSGGGYDFDAFRIFGSDVYPTGSWYFDVFAKPHNWDTDALASFPAPLRSTDEADRYTANETYIFGTGAMMFLVDLESDQTVEIKVRAFEEDPFKIDLDAPELIDTIPTDTSLTASEDEVECVGLLTGWVLRVA